MALIDKYVLFAMIFSICLLLFRSGIMYHKWSELTKNSKIVSILLMVPYILLVIIGIVLLITKEVVV
jgi:hypothetical protein